MSKKVTQKSKKVNTRFRCVSFTLNNYTEKEIEEYIDLCENEIISYLIMGKEIGEKGTPHLQGYMQFPKQLSNKQVKNLNKRMHYERCTGDDIDNFIYCHKDKNYYIYGERKIQGRRNDIKGIKKMVDDGLSMNEILNNISNLQQIKIAEKCRQYKQIDYSKTYEKEVIYIWGKTGEGKTHFAVESLADKKSLWIRGGPSKWFDGYDGQKDVIFNDFRDTDCSFSEMLNLLDKYEQRVEIKGAFTFWKPTRVIFTSVIPPEKMYKGQSMIQDDNAQFVRRINTIIKMEDRKPHFVFDTKYYSEVEW